MTTTGTHEAVPVVPDEAAPDETQPREANGSTPGGLPPDAEWIPIEPCAAFPPPPAPIPVLAPYLGLVAAVLSMLGGGWLLLAPYALDFRHGAPRLPRAATVDLETGAAVIAVGIVAAVLFSVNLALRLRTDSDAVLAAEPESEPLLAPEPDEPVIAVEPEPEPALGAVPSARSKEADPGGALRELLTPLVAALAADLRSHDQERTREQQQQHEQQRGDAYRNH